MNYFDSLVRNWTKILLYILVGLLIYLPLFGWMDWLPLRIYDEGRNAVNAVEMMWSDNYIVTTFGGSSDLYNTKPPLLYWMQIVSMKIFGISEVGIRFPSAAAALITCFILFWYFKKYLIDEIAGLISVFILITSQGYVHYHGVRSGDFDSPLTLFMFINALAFFNYIELQKKRYVLIFFTSLILAAYMKGIVAFMFFPAYLLYILFTQSFFVFKKQEIYVGGIISIALISAYFLLREYYDPGYLSALNTNDIIGRYRSVVDGHNHPWDFYLTQIYQTKFKIWVCFLVISLFTISEIRNEFFKGFLKYSLLVICSFLFLISCAKTKLIWYDMPIYPFLSIIATYSVYTIYSRIKRNAFQLHLLFLCTIFILPYYEIFTKVYIPRVQEDEKSDYILANYIQTNKEKLRKYPRLNIQWKGYNSSNIFYCYMLKNQKNQVLINKLISKEDYVITYQEKLYDAIKKKYKINLVLEEKGIKIFKIL